MSTNVPARTERSIHVPNVVALPECAEKCGAYRALLGAALLKTVENPDNQYAVVCDKYGRFVCHGVVEREGHFGSVDSEPDSPHTRFYPSAGTLYEGKLSGTAASDRITLAREAGAIDQEI